MTTPPLPDTHALAVLSGERKETCIDCHQGIAHKLPEEDEDEIAEIKAAKKTAQ